LSFLKTHPTIRAVSDSSKDSLSDLLSSFALGPSWAKATADESQKQATARRKFADADTRDPGDRRDTRRRDGRREDPRDRGRDDGGKPFRGRRQDRHDDRHGGPPRPQHALPAEGVRVTLAPDAEAIHLIGKEVHQVARVYPLYDVARILLAERGRCRAIFEVEEPLPPLLRGKLDDSLFLTRKEAEHHLWQSELRAEFLEEETIEVDPPTGNFQLVARCGISGEWLGPPNFHTYQINLRRIHRERFVHLPFPVYAAKVRTERGEEAVNAWLDTMRKKTHWRIKGGGDETWITDLNEAQRALAAACFDKAFEETRRAEVIASIPPKNLSPELMTSLKIAGNHARNHPAILIPAVCKALEAEHLPVFKRQGKLHTGPARPHPLPPDAVLAERPGIMVDWIRANPPAKLEGLWKAVLPEGGTAPPAEFAADLFWLLHQGHILLFTDDTLVVQEAREHPQADPGDTPKAGKKRRRKSKRQLTGESKKTPRDAKPAGGKTAAIPAAESPATAETPAESAAAEPAPAESVPVVAKQESSDNPSPGVDDTPPL